MLHLLWLLILIPIGILFIPFRLCISFNEKFKLEVRFLSICVYSFISENRNVKKHEPVFNKFNFEIQKIRMLLKVIKDIFLILEKHIRSKLTVSSIKFKIIHGSGDAAETAIRTGILYTAVYNFLGFIVNRYTVKSFDVSVEPDFDKTHTKIAFEISFFVSLFWVISLLMQERVALMHLNNILKKKDGVENE